MDNNFAGVGLIVLGMFFFSIQDILIKLIIVDTSLLQILVFRAVAGCILLIIFLLYTKRTITLGSAYPKIAITRSLLFFFGFILFYISISKINLAEATSLFFVSPFFMTIFSKLILKNYIGLNSFLEKYVTNLEIEELLLFPTVWSAQKIRSFLASDKIENDSCKLPLKPNCLKLEY